MIESRPVSLEHIVYLTPRLRAFDKLECMAAGYTAEDGLRYSVAVSRHAFTFLHEGIPLGAYGVCPIQDGGALFWLLGTDEIAKHGKDFLRRSLELRDKYLSYYKYLTNAVHVENKASIRWLTRLGAQWGETTAANGVPLIHFTIRR